MGGTKQTEGVQKPDGGTPQPGASQKGQEGQTSPQPQAQPDAKPGAKPEDDATGEIDLRQEYADPRDPERTYTGEQLLQMAERGKLLDTVQSKLHKQIAVLEKEVGTLKPVAEKAQQAQAQLDDVAARQKFNDYLAELGIGPASKKTQEPEPGSLWPTEPEPKPPVDYEKVLRGIEDFKRTALEELRTSMPKIAQESAEQIEAKKANDASVQKRVADFVSRGRRVRDETMKVDMPLVPTEKVTQIGELLDTAVSLDAAAKSFLSKEDLSDEDMEKAEEAWLKSQGYRSEAVRLLAEAQQEQKSQESTIQQKEQIEMLTEGALSKEELGFEEETPTRNVAEAEKRRASRLKAVKKRSETRRKMKNA